MFIQTVDLILSAYVHVFHNIVLAHAMSTILIILTSFLVWFYYNQLPVLITFCEKVCVIKCGLNWLIFVPKIIEKGSNLLELFEYVTGDTV